MPRQGIFHEQTSERTACERCVVAARCLGGVCSSHPHPPNHQHAVGEQLDSLNGVAIYYNGGVNSLHARNLSKDGYNLGLRYQCVEFIKRYYFERHGHRMPDSYGHAKDLFDPSLGGGAWNARRAMRQFRNGGTEPPQADDLLVFAPSFFNRYGHVAIVAGVGSDTLQIAQQNPGPFGTSRENLALGHREGRWYVEPSRVSGWLRLLPSDQRPVAEQRHGPRR